MEVFDHCGGYNCSNPTIRQFRSAYKNILIWIIGSMILQILIQKNCIPLEDIGILHYSSSDPANNLNNNTPCLNYDTIIQEENLRNIN